MDNTSASKDLRRHYQNVWQQAYPSLKAGNVELDPWLLSPAKDSRRGITLLVRPKAAVQARAQQFLQTLAQLEPNQYYYPLADLHVTVLSLISCAEGFTLDQTNPEEYVALINKAAGSIDPFVICFKGITASRSGVMLQGFPEGTGLEQLRNNLREVFKTSGLRQSIDQRYVLQTAHCTVARFQAPLVHPVAFLQKLEEYQEFDFGRFTVNKVELVFNDWYQRAMHTINLESFNL